MLTCQRDRLNVVTVEISHHIEENLIREAEESRHGEVLDLENGSDFGLGLGCIVHGGLCLEGKNPEVWRYLVLMCRKGGVNLWLEG